MREKLMAIGVIFFVFLLFLASQVLQLYSSDKTQFIFCDVGEGDGAVLIHKSKVILIDAGRDYRMERCLERHLPFWQKDISAVILTHPDSDHIAGLKTVIKHYSVKQLFSNFSSSAKQNSEFAKTDYVLIIDILRDSGVIFKTLVKGEKILINQGVGGDQGNWGNPTSSASGGLRGASQGKKLIEIKSLWPKEEHRESEKTNLYSSVLNVTIAQSSFLMLADSEIETQLEILREIVEEGKSGSLGKLGKSGGGYLAVKVSHHGSTKNYSQTLMKTLAPKYAIISVGTNKYGHPGKKVIESFEKINVGTSRDLSLQQKIEILRTDKIGDVVFECDWECKIK